MMWETKDDDREGNQNMSMNAWAVVLANRQRMDMIDINQLSLNQGLV